MTNLKEYIKFIVSLTEMDEVKEGKFPLPKEIVFELNKIEHAALQTQVHDAKGLDKESFEHKEVFTVDVMDVSLTFKENE